MTSLLISMALAVAAPVPKDDKEDLAFREKVSAAREKAVKFLKGQQGKDGTWEDITGLTGMTGGQTALAALALLDAGVPANDPGVAKAIEYLVKLEPARVYVVGLQIQALALTKDVKHLPQIQKLADWLHEKAVTKDGKFQGWSYPANGITDNSNTHFAAMGLHAAAQAGAKVDAEIWKKIRDYYADTQRADGGWVYHDGVSDTQTTASMTTAALLGLTVAAKYDKAAKGPHPAFETGMGLLLDGKFGEAKSVSYNLFTTAELGRELGTAEFKAGKAAKMWYREGAEKLVKEQQPDGSWKPGEKALDTNFPVVSTAFVLYFLGPSVPAKK